MKTSPTNKKIREIISMVKERKLLPRPEFQRRLVWSREDKNHFLDSILRGYPFPEIYFADGVVDLETGEGSQLLVDGLQRVSTIIQYFDGDPDLKLTAVSPYKLLTEEDKKLFLQYDVAVRDLGSITKEEVIEVFKRLNATKYSLLDIEINNAIYAGSLKVFCDSISENAFFKNHTIFNSLDYKRMGDLRYVLGIVGTMIQGYFNRDDAFESLLSRYNDDFPLETEILSRIQNTFDFIEECGFDSKSRAWKKADLFTLIIELDHALNVLRLDLQPIEVLNALNPFYDSVEKSTVNFDSIASVYYKSALQASNDKINRIRRGLIIGELIRKQSYDSILDNLTNSGIL